MIALRFNGALHSGPIWLALAVVLGCLPLSAAVLNGSFIPLREGTNVNLTTQGNLDWVHWGLGSATDINRKSSVAPNVGPMVGIGVNPIQQLETNYVVFSWSDGAPTPAVSNSPTGLFVQGLANGFEITASADTERRRLRIFAGAEAATGFFEASLSDGSAPGFYDESLASAGSISNGVFVLDFASASSGQTLTVHFTASSVLGGLTGRVLLEAATLASNLPPSVQLVAPTNNSTYFNSASLTLTASAGDIDGTVQRVEFYQNAVKLGEVVEPPYTFQWDSVPAGNYTLTARAFDNDGAASDSAPVSIVVLPNFAPTVAITNPSNLANFSSSAGIVIEATASDVDGTVTNVAFFANATRLGEATNSPYVFAWTNASPGDYQLTARATDDQGAITVSTAVEVFVTKSGGFLTAVPATVGDPVNLDTEGPADWAHWGLYTASSFDRKRGVVPQISNCTIVGGSPAYPYGDNANTYSWADGTPTAAVTNTATGIYVVGLQNGVRIQAPAGVTTNTLKVYVGAFAARGRLVAYLSDFSTPLISDFFVNNSGNGPSTVYTVQYAATTPNQTLELRFLVESMYAIDGNVTLQAAALDTGNHPPFASVTNPPSGITLLGPTNITISVAANDVDGSITNLEFFRDGVKLGQKTAAPYSLIWSNAAPGSHSLTARATDDRGATFDSRATDVFVTTGGGSLVASYDFPPPEVDLAAEGTEDWTHWGLSRASSFDHRSGATTRISDATDLGNAQVRQYTDNFTGFSWTNGTPTPSALASTTGIYVAGLSNGFQITAPADPARRRLKVYAGLYGARGRFEASLSDNSARSFTDTSLFNFNDNGYRVYTIDYASASPGQQLIIRQTANEVFDADFGNVTLQSATLADMPAPRVADESWNGTAFNFRVRTFSGRGYAVEYTDVLPAANWQLLETFSGTGADVWVTNSFPESLQRFYRVVEY